MEEIVSEDSNSTLNEFDDGSDYQDIPDVETDDQKIMPQWQVEKQEIIKKLIESDVSDTSDLREMCFSSGGLLKGSYSTLLT